MVWAATEGVLDEGGGEVGVPDADDIPLAERSLAEAEGMGRNPWPGEGLAGSSGGALRLFFGMDATGCELRTSL